MKKLNFIFALAILSFGLIISSCNETEYFEPTITITPADDTIKVSGGDAISYTVNVTSEDDLTSVKLTTETGSSQQILLDSTIAAGTKTFNLQFDLTFPNDIPAGTVGNLTVFAATANKSATSMSIFEFISTMTSFEAIVLQAQADGPTSADENLTFYSTSTNESFTYNQANTADPSAVIDFVFTHHSVFKSTNAELSFQSPDEQNLVTMWNDFGAIPFPYDNTNKNKTYFKKVTDVDWDNLDNGTIETVVGDIGTETILRGIEVDDFIAFETSAGNKGIVKVTETVIEHNPYNATTITFDVKTQK